MPTPTTPRQFATEAIHAGELWDVRGAHIAPIYQTATFRFYDTAAVDALWRPAEHLYHLPIQGDDDDRSDCDD